MSASDALLDGLSTLPRTFNSTNVRNEITIREKIALVLKDQFLSSTQGPCDSVSASGVSMEEVERIRQFVFGKLPLREFNRLITSSILGKPSQDEDSTVGRNRPRLPFRRCKTTNTERGNKKRPSHVRYLSEVKGRILQADCYPFESIQLGQFFVSLNRQPLDEVFSKRWNYVQICRRSNSLFYRISTERDGHRYVSTYMLPIPIINGIYFNGRDIFIRLDSCAMFESCTCDGDEVTFDVTDGERSNALFHHIVLRSDARAFREKLLNVNRVYVSKLIQSFHDFSTNIVGAASPDELRVKAKSVVSQNSRTVPLTNKMKLSDPRILFQKQRTPANLKGADGIRPMAARGEPLDGYSMIRKPVDDDVILNKQTLRSEYSLQQIPENESIAETPTPADRLPVYYPQFVDNAPLTSMERRLDTDCVYANEEYGSTIPTSSPVQEFPRLHGIPMAEPTTEEHQEPLNSNDHVSSGVPSLYVQQEYRSKDEEINGSLPVRMDHFDVPIWPSSPLHYDDNALDFLHLDDIPQSLLPGYCGAYGQSIIPIDDQISNKCLDTSAWASGANELATQDPAYLFNNL